MTFLELILIALGLAMDAFAVSLSNGMAIPNLKIRDALKFGIYFGIFQAIMPLIGWAAGCLFCDYITAFDHWIAFVLLAYIGGKMVYDVIRGEEEESRGDTQFSVLVVLAIATSIDALAAGVTFAFLPENMGIFFMVSIIGIITFVLCTLGALLGKVLGMAFGRWSQLAGGIVLISMGLKILIEHLFFA